jgi:hypothetical protein
MFFFFEGNNNFWYSPSHKRFCSTTIKPSSNYWKSFVVAQGVETNFVKYYFMQNYSPLPIKNGFIFFDKI